VEATFAHLIRGECLTSMAAMEVASIDLVVTSPPYLNIGMPYGDAFATIEDYIEFSRQWITAAARLLKPGGAMWINVGMHNGDPWYHGQRSFEIELTADSLAIIGQAVAAGRSMWKPNTRYAKAGVILLDLQAEDDLPRDLLPTTDPVRSKKLMSALDAVNARFGRRTLRPGGIRQVTPWSTRSNNRSPRYTTRFSDLMEVRA